MGDIMTDTIYAPATASGRAGVGILRISGPDAFSVAETICGTLPPPKKTALRYLRDTDGEIVDQALVISFEKGRSFTGEDVVEFQHHGSPVVASKLMEILSREGRSRPADAGEFTRRSLTNGVMDLVQVEGLADLLDADTEAQRRQAMRVMDGALTELVGAWRHDLLHAIALVEATIDFADEEVPQDVWPEVEARLRSVRKSMVDQLAGSSAASQIRTGFEIAIVGKPNAGKSSLINFLSRREVALTSEVAGTTRDIIEVRLDIGGHLVTVLDTAGLRTSSDEIERMGVELARRRAAEADIRLYLLSDGEVDPEPGFRIHPYDIVIQGKDDDGSSGGVSGKTGQGVSALLERIQHLLDRTGENASLLIRARHQMSVEQAVVTLGDVLDRLYVGASMSEFISSDLRKVLMDLDELIGRVGVEDVLGEIFSSFCIGK